MSHIRKSNGEVVEVKERVLDDILSVACKYLGVRVKKERRDGKFSSVSRVVAVTRHALARAELPPLTRCDRM